MKLRNRKASAIRALLGAWRCEFALLLFLGATMAALSMLTLLSRLSVFGLVNRPSAGDAILWAFMGNPIGLSMEWGGLCCLLCVAACPDLRGVMTDVGQPLLAARGSRRHFWYDVCAACVIRVLAVCSALMLCSALLACLLGGEPSLSPSCIEKISLGVITSDLTISDVALFASLVFVGAVSLSILGPALSLLCGRSVALAVLLLLLLGSAFAPMLPLPGSWLMVTRLAGFAWPSTVSAVWPPELGYAVFASVAILALALGRRLFSRLEQGLPLVATLRPDRREGRWRGGPRLSALSAQVRLGMHVLAPMIALGAAVCVSKCVGLMVRLRLYGPEGALPSAADFCAFAFMGSSQPEPMSLAVSVSKFAAVPFDWMLLVLLPQAYAYLYGLRARRFEIAVVLSGSRGGAWHSRCAATAMGACLIVLAELTVCLLASLFVGGGVRLECSAWFADVCGLARETLPVERTGLPLFLVSCACVQMGLALFQQTLGEFVGSAGGLLVVVATLAGSVFLMSPALIGNYLMCARSTVFVVPWQVGVQQGTLQAGLSPVTGIVGSLVVCLLSHIVGCCRAMTCDYPGGR